MASSIWSELDDSFWKTGGVLQEVADRYGGARVFAVIGKVIANRCIEIDRPFANQLHHEKCGELFGDRGNHESGVGAVWRSRIAVGGTKPLFVDDLAAFGHQDRSLEIAGPDVVLNHAVKKTAPGRRRDPIGAPLRQYPKVRGMCPPLDAVTAKLARCVVGPGIVPGDEGKTEVPPVSAEIEVVYGLSAKGPGRTSFGGLPDDHSLFARLGVRGHGEIHVPGADED